MLHTRLLELLRRLSASELSGFDKFLESPFFNTNEKVTALYRYLLFFAPQFEHTELNAAAAFAQVWGVEKPFDRATVNRLSSQLFKLAEQYLAFSALAEDENRRALYLLRRYEKLELNDHFSAAYRRMEQILEAARGNFTRFALLLESELIRAEWLNRNDDRTGEANLQQLNDRLDLLFIASKIKFLNEMLSRGAVSKTGYRLSWKDEVLQALRASPQYLDDPAVALQYRILQVLLQPGDMEQFDALHHFLQHHAAGIPAADLRDGYACLENAAKLVFPVQTYYNRLFELYREQLAGGILYRDGQLHHAIFRNVVIIALNLNEYEWSARFIDEHRERIFPESYRAATYLQNMALLHFYRGDFRKAQHYLSQSNPEDVYYKLADRYLLARIYFELRESEVLDNFLNAFAKFVFDQQKKIAAPKVRSYRAFINNLRQLHNLIHAHPSLHRDWSGRVPARHEEDRALIDRLYNDIAAEPVFYGQKWLLEKIEALKGGWP
jgi:hypothetical protein